MTTQSVTTQSLTTYWSGYFYIHSVFHSEQRERVDKQTSIVVVCTLIDGQRTLFVGHLYGLLGYVSACVLVLVCH